MAGAAPAIAAPAAPAGGAPAPMQTPAGAGGAGNIAKPGPEGGAAAKPAEPAKPPEPRRFKAKYKSEGREQELDLDEAEAVREIQKARHYDKTRGDFEKQQRALQQQIDAISKDPLAFLREYGVDLRSLAAQEQAREAELAKLSPEARRAAELEQHNQKLQEQLEHHATQQKQAAAQAEHQRLVQTTASKFDQALKLSGRTRNGQLLKDLATVEEMAIRAGEPDLSPEQLVAAAHKLRATRHTETIKADLADPVWRSQNGATLKEFAKTLVGSMEGQELTDAFGPEILARISKAALASYRKNPIPIVAGTETPAAPPPASTQRSQERQSASVWQTLDKLAG